MGRWMLDVGCWMFPPLSPHEHHLSRSHPRSTSPRVGATTRACSFTGRTSARSAARSKPRKIRAGQGISLAVCLDSPISEDAMIGLFVVGAAIEGMRLIIENAVRRFLPSPGSTRSSTRSRRCSGARMSRVPSPCGCHSAARKRGGLFHSQSIEAIYAHYPGLVVMTPATVEDAYSMLLEAVEIDDPVIFCEHKFLYYHLMAEKLPSEALPIGKARIAREGRDLMSWPTAPVVHEAAPGGGRGAFR